MSNSKDKIICPRCGKNSTLANGSCPSCKTPLRRELDISSSEKLIRFGIDEPEPKQETEQNSATEAAPSGISISPQFADINFIAPENKLPVMRLTFCKNCGQQNDEGDEKCRKCGKALEVVEVGFVAELTPVPRVWALDMLGAIWIALGIAAVLCGVFLIKADPKHPETTFGDYLWTGIVACAPGIMIVLRHPFCRLLFWIMTLVSVTTWPIILVLWLYGQLPLSPNLTIGISWFAVLSGLSVVSWLIVRINDAFEL